MWKTSINRTILECKGYYNITFFSQIVVLIEPYWNVKIAELGMNAGFYVVLIEPYWNVKTKYTWSKIKGEPVLIEPYWNVKIKYASLL